MQSVEYTDPFLSLKATFLDGGEVDVHTPYIEGLDKLLRDWFSRVGIKELSFAVSSPTTAVYRFEHADGRTWTQDMTFAHETCEDPLMTFDVPDPWRVSEFKGNREVRKSLVHLRNVMKLGTLLVERT